MDQNQITKLVSLNKHFYQVTLKEFDDSRQYFWKGWGRIIDNYKLPIQNSKLKVLDLGCGNGRFSQFLDSCKVKFEYTGLDFSEELLEIANSNLKKLDMDFNLIKTDLALSDWTEELSGEFDLVVAFGLIHHIPGLENRKLFLQRIASVLDRGGFGVVAAWQFDKISRMKEIMNDSFQKRILEELNIKGLENNDFILDWRRGERAYRYSHLVKEEEFESILPKNMKIIDSFVSDGKSNDVNRYWVIKNS